MADANHQDILEALAIDGLPPEAQQALLADIGDLIYRGSVVRIVERMDEDTKVDFEKLLDSQASEDEVMAFLTERVPEARQVVEETVAELRSDILAVTG